MAVFATIVTGKSEGRYTIETYPGGQMGVDSDLVRNVKGGYGIDLAVVPTYLLESEIPALKIFKLPFLFNSYDEADNFVEDKAGNSLLEMLSNIGIVGLAFFEDGMVGISNRSRPIIQVNDYSRLKVRVPSIPIIIDSISSLGAFPTPLAFQEVYTALRQRVVDSTLATTRVFYLMKYREVQKYFSLTNQFYETQVLIMNKKKFEAISDLSKEMFQSSALEASYYQKHISRKQERDMLRLLREAGVQIISDPKKGSMRERVSEIYNKMREFWKLIDCKNCPLPPWCCD
jgi:tripartite ATP-independent transporter DctP family solute receptor